MVFLLMDDRVTGKAKLKHGDVIRVGAEGPEIAFLRDPPPEDLQETLIVLPRQRGLATDHQAHPVELGPVASIGWVERVRAYASDAIAAIARVFR